MVLGAFLRRLEAIFGVFGTSLEDFKIPQIGKKALREQLKRKPLIFDKSCSRVGASMVFKDQSVPSCPKNRPTITAEGVGECMEGQIGGKSGPGVLRTRQSGDLGAWGEAWEGPGGGQDPLLRRSDRVWRGFPGHSLARSYKQRNKETWNSFLTAW